MNFLELIEDVSDPRGCWKVKHNLSAILFTTLCGVLCGAESWSDISDFCEAKRDWLSRYVKFDNGTPSSWTFRRIFTLLAPESLEWLLRTHALGLVGKDGANSSHIAIDGKALRGSKRHNLKCLHSISALCHGRGLILAELGIKQKSNEVGAMPLLLELLEVKGNTVTIDAAGCQQAIADKIIERKGEYVLALKKNLPKFYAEVSSYLQSNGITAVHCLKDYFDENHGRTVRRRYFACDIKHLEGTQKWAGLKSAVAVETISSYKNKPEVRAQWRYYISSHAAGNPLLPKYIVFFQ